jgi:hypothetical protein
MAWQGLSFKGLQNSEGSVIQSDGAPALAGGAELYQVWKGSGGDTRMWFSTFDGTSWADQQSLPDPMRTDARPGAAYIAGKLWVVWKLAGGDSIYYSTYSGAWTEQQQLSLPNYPVRTTDGPAIAGFDNLVYMMWKGSPDSGLYWTNYNPETTQWLPQQQLPSSMQSTAGPGLASFSTPVQTSTLCAAWKGSGDYYLYYSFLTSGGSTTWTTRQQMPTAILSDDGPGLVGMNSTLYAAWVGHANPGLTYTGYNYQTGDLGYIGGFPNGTGTPPVQEQLPLPLGSNFRPAVAAFSPVGAGQALLVFAWKGNDTDHSLYWTTATCSTLS